MLLGNSTPAFQSRDLDLRYMTFLDLRTNNYFPFPYLTVRFTDKMYVRIARRGQMSCILVAETAHFKKYRQHTVAKMSIRNPLSRYYHGINC